MKKIIISFVAFGLILWLLISQINVGDVYSIIENSNSKALTLSFIFVVFSYFARSLRFKVLLDRREVSTLKMYAIVCCHCLLNHIMPLRSGEASYPLFLNKFADVPLSDSLASLFVARVLDMITVLCCFVFGLLLNSNIKINYLYAISVSLFILLLSVLCLVFIVPTTSFFLKYLKKIVALIGIKSEIIASKINNFEDKIEKYFQNEDIKRKIINAFFLSFLVWGFTFGFFHVVLHNFGVYLSLTKVVLGATGCVFSNLLPINAVGSIGTLEAGWAIGFTLIGLSKSLAVSTGFGAHILLILHGAILSLFAWSYLVYTKNRKTHVQEKH